MCVALAVVAVIAVVAVGTAAPWQPPKPLRPVKAVEVSPQSDADLPPCDLAVVLNSRERVSLTSVGLAHLVAQEGVCHFHMIAAIPDLPMLVAVPVPVPVPP